MREKIENNIDHEIYQKSIGILNSFDKDFLQRIRLGNPNNYEEHVQSKYYHQLVEQYSQVPQKAHKLLSEALNLCEKLNKSKAETRKSRNEWTIAPHIIANCDCIVGYTMQFQMEL